MTEKKFPKMAGLAFVIATFFVLLVPFVLTPIMGGDKSSDQSDIEPPSLMTEEGANVTILSDLGSWYEKTFALRNTLISADATVRTNLFGVSNIEKVIVGSNGWLYYSGTMDDYEGKSPLSERELDNIASNLEIVQRFVEDGGASFAFTIAPNKNSLYPEFMPSRYTKSDSPHNAELLKPYLEKHGVTYVDAFTLVKEAQGKDGAPLYYKTDTHWNNKGAHLVSTTLLDALSVPRNANACGDFSQEETIEGDLAVMLFPANTPTEKAPAESKKHAFSWNTEADPTLAWVETTNYSLADSTLMMYRDSFANNMIPVLSGFFGKAYYSKYLPFDITKMDSVLATSVVIEKAERNLASLGTEPPVLAAYEVETPESEIASSSLKGLSEVKKEGNFYKLEGEIAEGSLAYANRLIGADSSFTICLEKNGAPLAAFEPFRTTRGTITSKEDGTSGVTGSTNPCGFLAYIDQSLMPTGEYDVSLIISTNGVLQKVSCGSVNLAS